MTLMTWLRSLLSEEPRSEKFEEALHATEEFTTSVRSIRQQIQPYALDRDPFAAMASARRFNDDQLEHLHEGPPH
jgi:phytoene/squalene synthetase